MVSRPISIKTFSSPNHKLTSYLYFEKEYGGSIETQDQIFTDATGRKFHLILKKIKSLKDSKEYGLRFQIDYTRPSGTKGKLENRITRLGSKMRMKISIFPTLTIRQDSWIENQMFTNEINFRNDIMHYTEHTRMNLRIRLPGRLRTEYSYRNIQNVKSGQPSELELL